jgi:Tfp pilus assembly protein PilF
MLRCWQDGKARAGPEDAMALQRTPTISEAVELAVQKVRSKDYDTGKAILAWVLKTQPENVVAWLWLARCIANREHRRHCLDRVAALDPFSRSRR